MIDLKLLNESESIELELEQNSIGGTNNYNNLDNKPQINGKTLQGNLTLEDLGIIVNAVKDILINGASIIDKNGNAIIPIANVNTEGVGKANQYYGIEVKEHDKIFRIVSAKSNEIDVRTNDFKPITPYNLDYAVKCAMTDGKGAEWTTEEKANARMRLGEEWRYIGRIETTEDVARMEMALDSEGNTFSLRKVRIVFKNMPNQSNSTNVVRLELSGVSQSGLIQPLGVKTTETARFSFYEIELFNNQPFVNQYFESLNSTTNNQYMQNKPSNRMVGETSNKEIQSITSVALIVPGGANAIGSGAYMEVWGMDA